MNWNTSEPPKDGTVIVAIGRVIWSDIDVRCSDPFTAVISWQKYESGFEGWTYSPVGLSLARSLEDKVIIDFWNEYPDVRNIS